MYNVHLLPASFGDSILIEYGSPDAPNYILIDGGPFFAFDEVMEGLKAVAPNLKTLELLVVTHVDIDHIDGIVKLLNQKPMPFEIKDVWFNGWEQLPDDDEDVLGGIQGEYLSALIKELKLPHNKAFGGKPVMLSENLASIKLEGGMELQLLSPTAKSLNKLRTKWEKTIAETGLATGDADAFLERLAGDYRYEDEEDSDVLGDLDVETLAEANPRGDKSPANGSSIAFIGTYEGKRCLFAGDAHSDKIKAALEDFELLNEDGKLAVDLWKLSHHGSRKSTLGYLMEMIDCKRMLISSDGKRYRHPDAETLAKLIKLNEPGLSFYFNNHSKYADVWKDEKLAEEYGFTVHFPGEGEAGISVAV